VRLTTAALAAAVAVAPLTAARADFPRLGIFRKRANKEEPPPKARSLVETLKSDPDEKKRKAAAVELRQHDPRTNADLIPTLIATLQRDPSPAVRAEAAETIGKLKPVAQQAGVALEQTLAADPADEVRKAAQQALWDYHLNGYRSAGVNPAHPQTPEPPVAKPRPAPAALPPVIAAKPATPAQPRPVTSGVGKGAIHSQTVEPPLAKPRPTVAPPTPALTVPPLPTDAGKPPASPSISPPPKADPKSVIPVPTPPPGAGLPGIPAAPTVPAGPTVPTIPPPK
jgi:hypothetical protein